MEWKKIFTTSLQKLTNTQLHIRLSSCVTKTLATVSGKNFIHKENNSSFLFLYVSSRVEKKQLWNFFAKSKLYNRKGVAWHLRKWVIGLLQRASNEYLAQLLFSRDGPTQARRARWIEILSMSLSVSWFHGETCPDYRH